jgi:hypothetical protein
MEENNASFVYLVPSVVNELRSIRRLARRFFGLRFLLQQSMQFSARLQHESFGKLSGRLLPFQRQIFYSHVKQRYIGFEAMQGSLYAGNAITGRQHKIALR